MIFGRWLCIPHALDQSCVDMFEYNRQELLQDITNIHEAVLQHHIDRGIIESGDIIQTQEIVNTSDDSILERKRISMKKINDKSMNLYDYVIYTIEEKERTKICFEVNVFDPDFYISNNREK